MSEFRVEVVQIGPIEPHANADRLEVTRVHGGYPCVIRKGEFREGDRAVYVSVDALVPVADESGAPHRVFGFLAERQGTRDGRHRVRAARLRGVFSMGLLVPMRGEWVGVGWNVGDVVAAALGVREYEPPEPPAGAEPCPTTIPTFTDVEGLRRWPGVLREGEGVVVTEKVHGCNARFAWHEGRFWCGSHNQMLLRHSTSPWWRAAAHYDLENRLRDVPDVMLVCEVYGPLRGLGVDMAYGIDDVRMVVVDAFDIRTQRYLDWASVREVATRAGLPLVPVLAEGPWDPAMIALAEGKTTLSGDHVREGIVVRPVVERFDERIRRVILKLHGEGFLTRGSQS